MKLINPFGPKIAVLKIPKNLINKINNEFEQILLSKKLVKKRDYSKIDFCLNAEKLNNTIN